MKKNNFRKFNKRPRDRRNDAATKELPVETATIAEGQPAAEAAAEESAVKASSENEERVEIIGIRFKSVGKIYYFSPNGFDLKISDPVIVETARGIEYGVVAIANRTVTSSGVVMPLKNVLRKANEEDMENRRKAEAIEERAKKVWYEKAEACKLDMVLVDVECTLDNSKILFYFTADGRVDFRDFVKELASVFKTRIELRQIGVRDEAKQIGGLGACGRPFCCSTFLGDFEQVSIKMAKEQGLSLNSTKISGTCGRLMCCLRYENDVYEEESRKTPRVDSIVETLSGGRGVVIENNVLAGLVKVRFDDDDAHIEVLHRDDVRVIGSRRGKKQNSEKPDAELKKLEKN